MKIVGVSTNSAWNCPAPGLNCHRGRPRLVCNSATTRNRNVRVFCAGWAATTDSPWTTKPSARCANAAILVTLSNVRKAKNVKWSSLYALKLLSARLCHSARPSNAAENKKKKKKKKSSCLARLASLTSIQLTTWRSSAIRAAGHLHARTDSLATAKTTGPMALAVLSSTNWNPGSAHTWSPSRWTAATANVPPTRTATASWNAVPTVAERNASSRWWRRPASTCKWSWSTRPERTECRPIAFSSRGAGPMTELSSPSSAIRSQELVGASRPTDENWPELASRPVYNLNATHLEFARLWNVQNSTALLTDTSWTRPAARSALVAILAPESSAAPRRKNVASSKSTASGHPAHLCPSVCHGWTILALTATHSEVKIFLIKHFDWAELMKRNYNYNFRCGQQRDCRLRANGFQLPVHT